MSENDIDTQFSNLTNTHINTERNKTENLKIKHRVFLWMSKGLPSSYLNIRHNDEFFTSTAQELLSGNTSDPFIIKTSRQLLEQQRINDDTKARRRLEKWAKRVIISYLLFVGVLVILNGASQLIDPWRCHGRGFISDTVMTVILSTTTINIIGLGVIILRGHFPNYSHDDKDSPVNITYSNQE